MVRYQPVALEEPIVVTGAAGFIGSATTNRLSELGYNPIPVDNEGSEWGDDLTDYGFTCEQLYGARTVIHLAADMGGVGYFHSNADFAASLTNTQIDINVLRAVGTTGARCFVASSACGYPIELQQDTANPPRLTEEQFGMGTPDALYGAAKLHLARMAAKLPHVRVGILHTIYGPGCTLDGPRAKFPGAIARKALAAKTTGILELWGNGQQHRSYLYIDDAVDRILRLTDDPDDGAGPINIGYDGAVTCDEIAKACLSLAGIPDATIHYNLTQPTGVRARDCSNDRWERLYGPTSDLPPWAGFEELIRWAEKQ